MVLKNSIVSYPSRGPWGDPKFRGNTSGHLVKDLIEFYKPASVLDAMKGSDTTGDVCRELGISYDGFDLSEGFDLLSSALPPKKYDLIFFHPPYWDIIVYSNNPKDLSSIHEFDGFMQKLFQAIKRLGEYLSEHGVLVVLIGDVRKKGEYYPLGAYIQVFHRKELKAKLIKIQHHCQSSQKHYSVKFIPLMHEEVLVLAGFKKLTWRELILRTLQELGGEVYLKDLYQIIAKHPKQCSNPTYQSTVRRTLQEDAIPVDRGLWKVK